MTPYNQFFAGHDGDALEIRNEATSNWRAPASWMYDWATGGLGQNDAGVSVNGYTCLTHCPLWQGVNIIAGDLGQVPIRLVKDEFNDQRNHPAWSLLRVRPNEMQTPNLFIETIIQWALVWGNGVALVLRQGSRPIELVPLRPDCLWPELVGYEGQQTLLYHYSSPTTGTQYVFFPDDLLHIQGLTGDGIWGYPLWQIARNTIGHGLALEKHGNKQFSNGARPGGVLEHPAKLGDEARQNLRKEWEAVHGGADNAGKIAILWEGMKFNATSLSNIDAQWIEAKKLNRVDVASLLNLPAHKLNALEDSSVRSNLEEQNETYKQMTLTRWATKLNQEFKRKLLTDAEWKSDKFEFVFDWDAFMRADIDTLMQIGDRGVKAEILNRNEARRLLGYAPYPGGERFGSPAINKTPEDGKDEPDNGRPPGSVSNRVFGVENAHKNLIYDRFLHLLEAESNRLRTAASGAKNFVSWLDSFYVGGQFEALSESVMGVSAAAAQAVGLPANYKISVMQYAKQRRAALLEACSTVTKDELPEMVERFIGDEKQAIAQGLLATALGENHGA